MISKYLILFLLTLLFAVQAYAQVLFVDQETKKPIAALSIYDANGQHIGLTDKDGIFYFKSEELHQQKTPFTVTTEHISYESQSIIITDISTNLVIELLPKSIPLDAIAINRAQAYVTVLTGYYRNLETFDNKTKYFSDGIVSFYIPNQGGKVRYKLLDYRIYIDDSVTQDFDAKMGPYFQIARLPKLNNKKLVDRIKSYDLNITDPHNLILEKSTNEVGKIEISANDQTSTFYLDEVLPDTVQKTKIFRLEAKTKSDVRLENYASITLEDLSAHNLISTHEHAIGSIKRKAEFGHIPYEGLVHFYVMARTGISQAEYKALSSSLESNVYKTEKISRYSYPFWEELEPYAIPTINKDLEIKLNSTMRLVE